MVDDQAKKLIIDEDWKEEAQREKEVLAAQEKEKEKEEGQSDGRSGRLPAADLSGLVSMLATQAFYAMGMIKTREDEQPPQDLEMAKFNIDMLSVIEEKTKGNLDDEESKVLSDTLAQLRMLFVQVSGGAV
jgi:hypothetical protein